MKTPTHFNQLVLLDFSKKSIILVFTLFFCISLNAQSSLGKKPKELKTNGIATLLLMPTLGFEMKLKKRTSFQVDAFSSFWNSVDGDPYKRVQLFVDFRYYPKSSSLRKLYVGPHIGAGIYELNNRFSYPERFYQKGQNLDIGATVGYKIDLTYNLGLEFYIGVGWSHSRFNNYLDGTDDPIYSNGRPYDLSSKWKPQRFGIMLTYSLHKFRKWNE